MRTTIFKGTAELVGILGIILGLVLVTYALRQNNEQLAEQSRQSVAEGVRKITLSVATSPELARLLSRDVQLEEMTDGEELQLIAWFMAWLKSAEHAFLQHKARILEEEVWFARRSQALDMLERQKTGSVYEWNRDYLVTEFVSDIDKTLIARKAR